MADGSSTTEIKGELELGNRGLLAQRTEACTLHGPTPVAREAGAHIQDILDILVNPIIIIASFLLQVLNHADVLENTCF